MKKALLYTLLFLLLTIVVFFALIFALPFLVWSMTDNGGQENNNVFDAYPLLLPSLSVIVWSLITLFIFIRNKYSDMSFGNIAVRDRMKIMLLGGFSVVLLKVALQPLMWIMDNEISENRYSIIQMWMHNDVLVIVLLSLIHVTLEAVLFSAILRELIIWSKRPIICVLVLSLLCTVPNMSEISASAALSLLCTFIPLMYGGWLFYRTSTIWPIFFGMVLYDILLFFTPLSNYITSAMIAALLLPWIVIYLAKKLSSEVEPITSR